MIRSAWLKNVVRRALAIVSCAPLFPWVLLALCAAAYAPLITRLGFYWDDFPISWIASTMGGEGLARYFSTNRPVWGLIYRATTPLLGSSPLTWQVFGLLMRWVTGLALWGLLRQIWPERPRFSTWAAMLFVLYPGFSQQFIAFMYSHFYIVLTSLLLSLWLMVLAQRSRTGSTRQRRWFWPLTAASALLSLLNLLAMEYFFLLDLLRPAILWIILRKDFPDARRRLRQVLIAWLPYLAVFAGAVYWRSFLFGFQTYQPTLLSRLRAEPLQALAGLLATMMQDIWKASAGALAKAFTVPTAEQVGAANLRRYWVFVTGGALLASLYILLYRPAEPPAKRAQAFQTWALEPAAAGLLALALAGGPFWLTDLEIGLVFPNDRFILPFMLGASLAAAGLLSFLPLPEWMKSVLLGTALGFTIGLHFQSAIVYNRDWSVQRSMFWQMVWRMPDLQPGTALLSNELPVTHYTDNSLSAPLNWIYDPNNDPHVMRYMLFYPTLRKSENLGGFQPGRAIQHDYLAATFYGNTSQMVTFYYQPPGCLRVLDPEVETVNWMVPAYLRDTLSLSTTAPILPAPPGGKPQPRPPAHIYGEEIAHGWCYYYEKADLARQFGDWEQVTALGDEAFANSDYPNDPIERFPFIEGYAHTGNWSRALELSREVRAVTPVMQPVLCRLWQRIARETPASLEQEQALRAVQAELACQQP